MGTATDSTEERATAAKRTPTWGPAVLAVLCLVAIGVAVAGRSGDPPSEQERDPLELADERELRDVVTAVSGIIRAGNENDEEQRLVALEALHPRSPGAADVRESCVSVYRGTHDAERLTREFRALMPGDGGAVPPESRPRLEEIYRRTRTLITEANESRDRCVALYQSAARRLHIEPARRPR